MLEPVLADLRGNSEVQLSLFLSSVLVNRKEAQMLTPNGFTSDSSPEEVTRWLDEAQPDLAITGTGWGSRVEQEVRNQARRRQIRSLTVIDYWANYTARWDGADYPIRDLTDEVCVVDETMKTEMVREGFPEAQLFVSGHPYLESLSHRATAPIHDGKVRTILFLSEPLRAPESFQQKAPVQAWIGKFLDALSHQQSFSPSVQLKHHPKEDPGSLPPWAAALSSGAHSFDLVMGYHSMGLLEAALEGKATFAVPICTLSEGVLQAFRTAGIACFDYRLQDPHQAAQEGLDHYRNFTGRSPIAWYNGSHARLLNKALRHARPS